MNYKINLLILLTFISVFACSIESEDEIESTSSMMVLTNPRGFIFDHPKATLDESSQGIYQGVFSTFPTTGLEEVTKGVISINVNNDGYYVAQVELNNNETLNFYALNTDLNNIRFVNELASFTLDVTSYEDPVATEVQYKGRNAYIKAYKEKSNRNVIMVLGDYYSIPQGDQVYHIFGNWDFQVVEGVYANGSNTHLAVQDITISRFDEVYSDSDANELESFNDECGGNGIFTTAGIELTRHTVQAFEQKATFKNKEATWSMGKNPNTGLCDDDYLDKGQFTWKNRVGTITVGAPTFEGPTSVIEFAPDEMNPIISLPSSEDVITTIAQQDVTRTFTVTFQDINGWTSRSLRTGYERNIPWLSGNGIFKNIPPSEADQYDIYIGGFMTSPDAIAKNFVSYTNYSYLRDEFTYFIEFVGSPDHISGSSGYIILNSRNNGETTRRMRWNIE